MSSISYNHYGEKRVKTRELHGMTHTKEYRIWTGIIGRTSHPCASTREHYYDKGIRMSDEWRESFLAFYNDMGDCPEGYTIDRIDPKGNYCKENCKWSSVSEQAINKGIAKNNTSGVRGVSYNKDMRKWESYIMVDKKKHRCGFFENLEDAKKARLDAEIKFFGEIKSKEI